MLIDDNALKAYADSLNAWHLDLGITVNALKCFLLSNQVDKLDDYYADLIYVLQQKLDNLLESCPFPPK